MGKTSTKTNFASPLSNKGFFKLLIFRVFMVLSYQIMDVVVGWHIYQLTKDLFSLGLIGLSEFVPYFCCALFAGYLVDHYSKHLFGVFSAILLCINALILAACSAHLLESNETLWIYLSIILVGLLRGFIAPTYNTLFAYVMPREEFAKAAGIGSSVFQFGLILGPAFGGLLVAYASVTVAYIVSAIFAFLAAISLSLIGVRTTTTIQSNPIFLSIAQGIKFVFNNQVVLGAQALDMFAVLFGGAVAMLPAFIHDVYHIGPEGLGVLRAAPALGAITVGLVFAKRPITENAGKWLLTAVAGFGLCMITFAMTKYFWVAVFLLMLSGVFDGVSVILRTTILQLVTPDDMRGRVASINGLFIGSSNELGAFESGFAAKVMGLIPSVVFGGAMTLGVVLLTTKAAPQLVKLDLNKLH